MASREELNSGPGWYEVVLDSDVIREIKAEAWDEGYGRGGADHCDYWPSHEGCEVSSPNPYLPTCHPRGVEK